MISKVHTYMVLIEALLAVVVGMGGAASFENSQSQDRMAQEISQQDPLAEDRNAFLDVIAGVPDSEYVEVENFVDLPGEVYFASVRWQRNVFRADRSALEQPSSAVQRAYHLARRNDPTDYDLLRHRYVADGLPVTVIECAGLLYIEAAKDAISSDSNDPLKQLKALATYLFTASDSIQFDPIPSDGARRSFSTNPSQHLASMNIWDDRIDGVSSNHTVGLVVYKVSLEHDDIFIDMAKWFPTSFRDKNGE